MAALRELQSIGLDYLLLLFLRVAGIVWSSPVFGRNNIPQPAKISLALALSYFFYTSVPVTLSPEYGTLLTYALLCVKEIMIGVIMGFILTLFFSLAYTAGQMIDIQMGLGMATVYDPQSSTAVPLLGNMLNIMLILVFFALRGHQKLVELLYLSILRIPIGGVNLTSELVETLLVLCIESFSLGIRMALPILAAGLLTEAILGIIIHSVPQMNIFTVGMPLKVVMGFVVLLIILPMYSEFSVIAFERMFAGMERVLSNLAGV